MFLSRVCKLVEFFKKLIKAQVYYSNKNLTKKILIYFQYINKFYFKMLKL